MAERRMFAKTIIDSDAFLDMPLSAQALYFHLSMRADDEGFINNPKRIQRTIGASDDDFKILLAKNFILSFESGVIVIKHWKIHNYIRNDRMVKSKYEQERSLLTVKENGSYTLSEKLVEIPAEVTPEKDLRKQAYEESTLPYSFDYKIRTAFWGKKCPICGAEMKDFVDECGVVSDAHRPTIQHNKPISKGGKHELGNISVICHKCNVTIQDTETEDLNATEVAEVWDGLSSACQMSVKCPSNVGIGKYSIGKDSIVKDSIGKDNIPPIYPPLESGDTTTEVKKDKPVKHKYGEYQHVLLTDDEYNRLCNDFTFLTANDAIKFLDEYIEEKGAKYKSHNLTIRRWVIEAVKERDRKRRCLSGNKAEQQLNETKDALSGFLGQGE